MKAREDPKIVATNIHLRSAGEHGEAAAEEPTCIQGGATCDLDTTIGFTRGGMLTNANDARVSRSLEERISPLKIDITSFDHVSGAISCGWHRPHRCHRNLTPPRELYVSVPPRIANKKSGESSSSPRLILKRQDIAQQAQSIKCLGLMIAGGWHSPGQARPRVPHKFDLWLPCRFQDSADMTAKT